MSNRIKAAVFPVAGFGTRVLPATKSFPKEMLPVVDRPLIHYAVMEAAAAGVETFVFVTNRGKQAIEDYFDIAFELDRTLDARGKDEVRASIRDYLFAPGRIVTVRQMEPLGLGHAVWCARNVVGDAPFAVVSPDDLVMAETPCLKQLADVHDETGGNVVAVMDVPREHTNRYGVLETPNPQDKRPEVAGLVEKPDPADAPSTLTIIGRYILTPDIFAELDRHERGAGGEIQLTDAMAKLIGRRPFHGLRFEGTRFDCGTREGWLEANLAFALDRADTGPHARGLLARYAGGAGTAAE